MTLCNVALFKESLIISDISFQYQHQRMGLTKQLGEHMLGSSHSTKGAAGELSDKQALKEALKLAKHKGGLRVCIVAAELTFTIFMSNPSDLGKLDPRVMDYAATRLQAGFRGWQTRHNIKRTK